MWPPITSSDPDLPKGWYVSMCKNFKKYLPQSEAPLPKILQSKKSSDYLIEGFWNCMDDFVPKSKVFASQSYE